MATVQQIYAHTMIIHVQSFSHETQTQYLSYRLKAPDPIHGRVDNIS